jgi:hypothetical protein
MAQSDRTDQAVAQEFRPYGADREQLDMFGSPPVQSYDPDPESVRSELLEILAKARAAPDARWDPREASLYSTVFPQMANWLPADEAAELRRAFRTELERLGVG